MSGLDDLEVILAAVAIESPTRYLLDGVARDVAPPIAPDAAPADVPLVRQLQAEMYGALYCRLSGRRADASELADWELVHALSAANGGHGTWEPGWVVAGAEEDGRIPVRKDGLTLWVEPRQLRARGLDVRGQGPGRRAGSPCRVRVGKELREVMAGFYFAIGDGDEREDRDADEGLIRIYWHVHRDGASSLIGALTEVLNPLRIPFRAKVVSFGGGYPRSDAGVLYLDRRYYPRVAAVLPRIHAAVLDHLDDAVPRFTLRLGRGLGLAEDPGADESFGQSRCRVVTEALWRGFRAGVDPAARLAHVVRAFTALGLDAERPYLQPGSPGGYGVLGAGAAPAPTPPSSPSRPSRRPRGKTELRARRKQERQWRRPKQRR